MAVAIYKVTNDEVMAAQAEFRKSNPDTNVKPKPQDLPMISYAWLFPDILGRVALRYFDDSAAADERTPAAVKPDMPQNVTKQEGEERMKSEQEREGEQVTSDAEKSNSDTTDWYSIRNKDDNAEDVTVLSDAIPDEEVEIIEDGGQIKPGAIDILEDMLFDSEED